MPPALDARVRPAAAVPALPALHATRLLDQVRERVRFLHYSRRTEEAYVHWVRAFVRFNGLKHPRELGGPEVEAFLGWLASERSVSASTHKQALSALLFLYTKVLGLRLRWMNDIGRPRVPRRLPVVLTVDEVARVLGALPEEHQLLAALLYGAGLRLLEGLQLRVKDLDFGHRALIVRQGKGGKDRVVMLPESLVPRLQAQLRQAHRLWAQDREAGCSGVWMADALERKYPRAGLSWAWFWVFPQAAHSTDPRTGVVRRHHLVRPELPARVQARGAGGRGGQAGHTAHAAAFVCDASAAARVGHPHGAGAAGPRRRGHDDGLHPCAQARGRGGAQPGGCDGPGGADAGLGSAWRRSGGSMARDRSWPGAARRISHPDRLKPLLNGQSAIQHQEPPRVGKVPPTCHPKADPRSRRSRRQGRPLELD